MVLPEYFRTLGQSVQWTVVLFFLSGSMNLPSYCCNKKIEKAKIGVQLFHISYIHNNIII